MTSSQTVLRCSSRPVPVQAAFGFTGAAEVRGTVTWRSLAAALLAASLQAGCGTLYNETRDKQGQGAKDAWTQAQKELAAQIEVPRKNNAALLAKQLEVAQMTALARRDQLARAMVAPGPAAQTTVNYALASKVRTELAVLVGGPVKAQAWLASLDKARRNERELAGYQREYRRLGAEMPSCAALRRDEQDLPTEAERALARLRAADPRYEALEPLEPMIRQVCRDEAKRVDKLSEDLRSGLKAADKPPALQQTLLDVEQTRRDLAKLRAAGLARRASYQAAQAEYDAAAQRLQPGNPSTGEALSRAAQGVQRAAQALLELQDAVSLKFISEQQQTAIDQFLAPLADAGTAKPPAADANPAAAKLVLLSRFIDQAQAGVANARTSLLVPLAVARNMARIQADAASRDVDMQERREALMQRKLQWQTQRVSALRNALIDIDGSVATDVQHSLPKLPDVVLEGNLFAALSPLSGRPSAQDTLGQRRMAEKTRLWKATALYLDAEGRLAGAARQTDIEIRALEYERALGYAEANVAQWNVLISTAVNQMADFGAAGVRKEDIVALVNSLTLLWIGKGVN